MSNYTIANLILLLTLIYGALGALFSILFVWRGARAIDQVATGTPLKTRILFAPGALALWPLLLMKWRNAGGKA